MRCAPASSAHADSHPGITEGSATLARHQADPDARSSQTKTFFNPADALAHSTAQSQHYFSGLVDVQFHIGCVFLCACR
eukprot:11488265-Alexandrium_andersonii.AAC.1